MKQVQLQFGVKDIWEKKLSKNHSQYLVGLVEESHEAMTRILETLEGDWEPEVTRFPICIETNPFDMNPVRKYLMASDAEFLHIKHSNPELIVRTLTDAEMLALTQQEERLQ